MAFVMLTTFHLF